MKQWSHSLYFVIRDLTFSNFSINKTNKNENNKYEKNNKK